MRKTFLVFTYDTLSLFVLHFFIFCFTISFVFFCQRFVFTISNQQLYYCIVFGEKCLSSNHGEVNSSKQTRCYNFLFCVRNTLVKMVISLNKLFFANFQPVKLWRHLINYTWKQGFKSNGFTVHVLNQKCLLCSVKFLSQRSNRLRLAINFLIELTCPRASVCGERRKDGMRGINIASATGSEHRQRLRRLVSHCCRRHPGSLFAGN